MIIGWHKGSRECHCWRPGITWTERGPSLGCLPIHWQFGLVSGLVHVLVADSPPLPGGLGPLLAVAVGPLGFLDEPVDGAEVDPGKGLGLGQLEQVAVEEGCEDVVVAHVVVHVGGGASGGEDGTLIGPVSSADVSLGWVDCHLKVSGCMWRSWRHPRG